MKTVYIYTLNCPDTGQVMYVGQTVNPEKRLKQHMLCYSHDPENKKAKWIKYLKSHGKIPHLKVIDSCLSDKASQLESEWIKHYSSINHDLTNTDPACVDYAQSVERRELLRLEKLNKVKSSPRITNEKISLKFCISKLVRDLEDLKGEMYSFAQLSKMSGVDQRYISSWVQGDADYIRFQHVEKFLEFLHGEGVDVSKGCTLTVTNEPEPPISTN